MKVVRVSKNKWRKFNAVDWVRENFYVVSCAMLILVIVYMTIKIIRAL